MNPILCWIGGVYLGVGFTSWLLSILPISYYDIVPEEWWDSQSRRRERAEAEGNGEKVASLSLKGFLSHLLLWWGLLCPTTSQLMAGALLLLVWRNISRQFTYWRMLPEEREVVRLERLKAQEETDLRRVGQQEYATSEKKAKINQRKAAAIATSTQLKLDIQALQQQKCRLFQDALDEPQTTGGLIAGSGATTSEQPIVSHPTKSATN